MDKYTINWLEKKESKLGKPYYKVSLKKEDGEEITDVAVFSGFPDFANLAAGKSVMGKIEVKQNGQYLNKTLIYPKLAPTGNFGASRGITVAMDRKEKSIEKAQDSKELSIKIASTIRMAVDLAIAENRPTEDNILKWRKWAWENWDAKDTDFAPFPDDISYEKNPDTDIEFDQI